MFDELFSRFRKTPAAQDLLRRVESGGTLLCGGVTGSGHAFLAAWLHREFPHRPLLLVAENLKAQETLHQDLETWLGVARRGSGGVSAAQPVGNAPTAPIATIPLQFFPAWEILPHEDKLPHADVISERLETLVSLMGSFPGKAGHSGAPRITTSVTALLQRTFPPAMLAAGIHTYRWSAMFHGAGA